MGIIHIQNLESISRFNLYYVTERDTMTHPSNPNSPKLSRLVIKYSGGIIKNDTHANYVLVGFVVLAFSVSLFLVFGNRSSTQFDPEEYPYGIVSPEAT
jgi:hypothetical protein